jgi:hypothetical protein
LALSTSTGHRLVAELEIFEGRSTAYALKGVDMRTLAGCAARASFRAAVAAKPGGAVSVRVDFTTQIQPIFQARCQPCHFVSGKVCAGLPFDRPATILGLGEKLFTCIEDENQRRTIREFFAQQAASSANAAARPSAGS